MHIQLAKKHRVNSVTVWSRSDISVKHWLVLHQIILKTNIENRIFNTVSINGIGQPHILKSRGKSFLEDMSPLMFRLVDRAML